jgi:hypothetical protein
MRFHFTRGSTVASAVNAFAAAGVLLSFPEPARSFPVPIESLQPLRSGRLFS